MVKTARGEAYRHVGYGVLHCSTRNATFLSSVTMRAMTHRENAACSLTSQIFLTIV